MKLTIETANTGATYNLNDHFLTESNAILLTRILMRFVSDYIEEGLMSGDIAHDENKFTVQLLDDDDQPLPFTYDDLINHVKANGCELSRDESGRVIVHVHGKRYNPDRHFISLPTDSGGVWHV